VPPVRPLLRAVALFLAGSILSLADAACGLDVRAGYSGPYPSAAAQEALHALTGSTIPAAGSLGAEGARLALVSFGVVPNGLTGLGPVAILREEGRAPAAHDPNAPQGADGQWILPVLTDGDAADLVQRATGSAPPNFGGPTSAAYRETLGLEDG